MKRSFEIKNIHTWKNWKESLPLLRKRRMPMVGLILCLHVSKLFPILILFGKEHEKFRCYRTGFELAPSGCRIAALPVLWTLGRLVASFINFKYTEYFPDRTLHVGACLISSTHFRIILINMKNLSTLCFAVLGLM